MQDGSPPPQTSDVRSPGRRVGTADPPQVLLAGDPEWADGVGETLRSDHGFVVSTDAGASPLDLPSDVECLVTDDPAVLREWDDERGVVLHGRPDGDLGDLLAAAHTDVVPRDDESLALLAARIEHHVERYRTARRLDLRNRAIDQANVGITMADADAGYPMTFVNERFSELTGYEPAAIIGDSCSRLQGPDTDPETVDEIRTALADEEPVSVDILNYHTDGTEFWNQLDIAPVRDDDGTVTGYFGFQKDITERKRLERDLRRRNESLEEFASVVSHDIRNPVSVALGNVRTARDLLADDPAVAARLDDATGALDRVEALVEEILTVARNSAAVEDPGRVVVSEVATDAWSTVETGDVSVAFRGGPDAIRADRKRLRTLFENLFRNACEHGETVTTITITTTEDGFLVEDDGCGIPREDRETVFERGFTTDEDGTGFGLAIVGTIAEAHGWSVSVGESPDGGASFRVSGVETL